MPAKKTNAAVSAAIQTGLSVRGKVPAVKATKAVAKTATKTTAAKKVTTPAKAAPAKAVRPKVPKAAPAADGPLWDDSADLKAAALRVVRHVHKYSKMDGYEFLTLASGNAYWARADVELTGFGLTIAKGTWLLAFDYANKNGEARTRVYWPDGKIAKDFPLDMEAGQGFTYFND